MLAREFHAIALNKHNYPIWAMDIKFAFDPTGTEDMIVEYASTDMFGDFF